MKTLANAAWPACTSALRLDRWMAGELGAVDSEDVRAHVAGCSRCANAADSLRAARDATSLPPLRAAPAPRRRAPLIPAIAAMGVGLAAAAALVLHVRLEAPAERAKGNAVGLGMFVLHGDEVREAEPGEAIAPGDAVRFAVTTPKAAYVAILSLDPARRASIYFPQGGRAAPVAAGTGTPLPLATRLDATVGHERIVGLFCDRPVELEPVRAGLEAGDASALPEGCQVTRWSFEKR